MYFLYLSTSSLIVLKVLSVTSIIFLNRSPCRLNSISSRLIFRDSLIEDTMSMYRINHIANLLANSGSFLFATFLNILVSKRSSKASRRDGSEESLMLITNNSLFSKYLYISIKFIIVSSNC